MDRAHLPQDQTFSGDHWFPGHSKYMSLLWYFVYFSSPRRIYRPYNSIVIASNIHSQSFFIRSPTLILYIFYQHAEPCAKAHESGETIYGTKTPSYTQ
jgi:hypothetical protein